MDTAMRAAFATHSGHAASTRRDAHAKTHALRFVTFIAPLLSGFAIGAGLGVLLWQLF
jgi:hypothetical protein